MYHTKIPRILELEQQLLSVQVSSDLMIKDYQRQLGRLQTQLDLVLADNERLKKELQTLRVTLGNII